MALMLALLVVSGGCRDGWAAGGGWAVASDLRFEGWPGGWVAAADGTFYWTLRQHGEVETEEGPTLMVAVDVREGRARWKEGRSSEAGPLAPGGRLLLAEGTVVLSDVENRRWLTAPRLPPLRGPWNELVLASEPRHLVGLGGGCLVLIDTSTWQTQWMLDLGGRLSEWWQYRRPAVVDGRIHCIVDDREGKRQRLLAVEEATGRVLWEADVGVTDVCEDPFLPIRLSMCSVSDGALVCLFQRSAYSAEGNAGLKPLLLCLDAETRRLRWRRELEHWPFGDPVIAGDLVLMDLATSPDARTRVVFSLADGSVLGRWTGDLTAGCDQPVVAGGYTVCGVSALVRERLVFLSLPWLEVAGTVELAALEDMPWLFYLRAVGDRVVALRSNDALRHTTSLVVVEPPS